MTDEDTHVVSWPVDATAKYMTASAPVKGQSLKFGDSIVLAAGPGAMWPGLVPVPDGEVFGTCGHNGAFLIGPLAAGTAHSK